MEPQKQIVDMSGEELAVLLNEQYQQRDQILMNITLIIQESKRRIDEKRQLDKEPENAAG